MFGVSPALVFFTDQVLGGHHDVVKKHVVHFHAAIHRSDRAHADALGFHVDQQKADAGLGFAFGASAHQAENPVAKLAQRGPGLLAVDQIRVALALGFAAQRCQVGARIRLAVTLAPPDFAAADAGQKALLLFGIAKGHDDGGHHHRAKRQNARRTGHGALLFKQVFLDRVPAGAAKLGWPAVTQPALFAQNLTPVLLVVTRQIQGVVNFVRDVFGQVCRHPGANVFAKLLLFRGKCQIHKNSPLILGQGPVFSTVVRLCLSRR